jgi:glyoxylase-like metal-dependent hydrolase (beta-lactamase superfamily II)
LALSPVKCQSSEVPIVTESQSEPGAYELTGTVRTLTYRPRSVSLDDGTLIAHESQGGTLSSVWTTDLGDRYVEVVHLGDGPAGGELVVVVPDGDVVLLGDLYEPEPAHVPTSWPEVIDLALGLTTKDSTILTSHGAISRDELEDFHQRLLGALHG